MASSSKAMSLDISSRGAGIVLHLLLPAGGGELGNLLEGSRCSLHLLLAGGELGDLLELVPRFSGVVDRRLAPHGDPLPLLAHVLILHDADAEQVGNPGGFLQLELEHVIALLQTEFDSLRHRSQNKEHVCIPNNEA